MEQIITKTKVLEEIETTLKNVLASAGFKYIKSKNTFIKKTNFGFVNYTFDTINYWPVSQQLIISLGIRYDEIEKLILPFYDERFRNLEFAPTNPTFGFNLIFPVTTGEHFIDETYYSIENESDLSKLKNILPEMIKNQGFALEEKYSILENVSKYYKEKYENNVLLEYPVYAVYMRFLATLKLTQDPEYKKYRDAIFKEVSESKLEADTKEKKAAMFECISFLDAQSV